MQGPAARTSKKGYGKRVGTAPSGGPHLRLFSTKFLSAIGARLVMLVISLAFLAGLGYAFGGKELKRLDFAHKAQAAYQNVANALTGR
jgi:hypothetical protein